MFCDLIDNEAYDSSGSIENESQYNYTNQDLDQFIDNGEYPENGCNYLRLDNKRNEEEEQRYQQELNKKILAYEQQKKVPYPASPISHSQEALEKEKQKEITKYVKAIITTGNIKKNSFANTTFLPIKESWRKNKSLRIASKRTGCSKVLSRIKKQRKKIQLNTYKKKVTKMMSLRAPVTQKKKSRPTTPNLFGNYTGECKINEDPYGI